MLMVLCCLTPVSALDVSAHSAILMDKDTGEVLYEKNPDEKSLIASTTKIMTALVTLKYGNLEDIVEVPREAVGIEGSSMYLTEGEQLRVEDLLHGLMLSSGNDAAVALALYVSGSIEDFAELMNREGEELGLLGAHFANPNGLDSEENYATARDLGLLASAALENPDFLRIVSAKTYQCEGHAMTNHNKLLWQYDGAVGVKTGFTKKAGRILVGGAERNGRTLVSVTINAPDDWQDHKSMLDYGFSQYTEELLLEEGAELGEIPVISGEMESAKLISGGRISCWMLPRETVEIKLHLPEFLYAPVEAKQQIGTAEFFLAGKSLGTVLVLIEEDVDILPEEKSFWQNLLKKFGCEAAGMK